MPIDYNQYPKNWKTEIRPKVLERANNCCEFCGVENHRFIHRFGKGQDDWEYYPEGMMAENYVLDGRKATKIILTIAHLDHDKLNHDVAIDRLRALCQKCHLQYDIKHHVSNRINNKNKNNFKLDL